VDHGGLWPGFDGTGLHHRAGLPTRLRRCAASARQVQFSGEQRLDRAKQGDPDERDDLRPVAADLPIQDLPSFDVFSG